MICPVCGDKLRTIDRSGIEIDICPSCKGIWLDRGELDKLLDIETKSTEVPIRQNVVSDQPEPMQQSRRIEKPYHDHDDHDDYDEHDRKNQKYDSHSSDHGINNNRKKKGSWLGDILGGIGGDD